MSSEPEYIALVAMYQSRATNNKGEIQVLRRTCDGDDERTPQMLVRYQAESGQDPRDTLAHNGWTVTGQTRQATGPGDPLTVLTLKPHDWPGIVGTLTVLKAAADEEAEARDAAWRLAIRDGANARCSPNALAKAAGISRERVYQIKDNRR